MGKEEKKETKVLNQVKKKAGRPKKIQTIQVLPPNLTKKVLAKELDEVIGKAKIPDLSAQAEAQAGVSESKINSTKSNDKPLSLTDEVSVMITIPAGILINGKRLLPGLHRVSQGLAETIRFMESKYNENELKLHKNNGQSIELGAIR